MKKSLCAILAAAFMSCCASVAEKPAVSVVGSGKDVIVVDDYPGVSVSKKCQSKEGMCFPVIFDNGYTLEPESFSTVCRMVSAAYGKRDADSEGQSNPCLSGPSGFCGDVMQRKLIYEGVDYDNDKAINTVDMLLFRHKFCTLTRDPEDLEAALSSLTDCYAGNEDMTSRQKCYNSLREYFHRER